MNIKPMINFFTRALHKKGNVESQDEFSELLAKTKVAVDAVKVKCVTVSPMEYFAIRFNSEVINVGVLLDCLTELTKAMDSTGNDKYIDVPTFNRGFTNSVPSSLDKFLTDSHGQWVRYGPTVDEISDLITGIEVRLATADPKMMDYYKGHSKRVITRVYNIFKQL